LGFLFLCFVFWFLCLGFWVLGFGFCVLGCVLWVWGWLGDRVWDVGFGVGFGKRHGFPKSTDLRPETPRGQQTVSVCWYVDSTNMYQISKIPSLVNQTALSDPQVGRDLCLKGWRKVCGVNIWGPEFRNFRAAG